MLRNWPLLIRTAQHIREHPEQWDQTDWVNSCGTAFCFAGTSIMLDGHEFLRDGRGDFTPWVIIDEALSPFVKFDAIYVGARDAGRYLLGLDEDETSELFHSDNDFHDIAYWLNTWAREDGIDLPVDLQMTDGELAAEDEYRALPPF